MPSIIRGMLVPLIAAKRSFNASLSLAQSAFGLAPIAKPVTVLAGPLAGAKLLLMRTERHGWQQEMARGTFDKWLFDQLEQYEPQTGKCIWDVGGHIGYHSLAFARLVGPNGHVQVFEPNRFNAARIKDNCLLNTEHSGSIDILDVALSIENGETEFLFTDDVDIGFSSMSYLANAAPPCEANAYASFQRTRVKVRTGDSLIEDNEIPPPSFVKIDVEGAEALVLGGMRKTLDAFRPTIAAEIHTVTAMHDVLAILHKAGYSTRVLSEKESSPSRCFLWAET